jgi:hypothetical protein
MATIYCFLKQGAILQLSDPLPSNVTTNQVNLAFGANTTVPDAFWASWTTLHEDSPLLATGALTEV